jgi:uncharacterized cupredoxin-like copper-binding protein
MQMGVPAASSAAPARTIALSATDQFRFTPDTITVQVGESVAFEVTNSGVLPHELVIGDAGLQAEHEAEMTTSTEMASMHHEPFAILIPAGKTARLTYTFSEPGTLLYGCHLPGHYAAGMVGTIVVGGS